MSANLKDIANHVGISVSTVSRVLNNKGRISEETRKKVLDAAEDLNYLPNQAARELKTRTSMTIGVMIPDVTNSFYVRLLKSIDQALWDLGYSIIFCDTDEKLEREMHYYELLKSKNVSGMIISTACKNDIYEREKTLANYVFVDNMPYVTDKPFSFVSIDNVQASYQLMNKVIGYGHRDIAMITGDLEETSSAERLEGYKKALEEHGISYRKDRVYFGNCHAESGYEAMKKLLSQDPLPSVVYTHNNVEAYGVLKALKEAGRKVPEDISVVCFDGLETTALSDYDLTCVLQPVEEIGRQAVKMIIENVGRRPGYIKNQKTILDYQIHEGTSLKKLI